MVRIEFATSIKGGKTKLPFAFTERGLYMLATILKSEQAPRTTLAIIDAFYKLRLLARQLTTLPEADGRHKSLNRHRLTRPLSA